MLKSAIIQSQIMNATHESKCLFIILHMFHNQLVAHYRCFSINNHIMAIMNIFWHEQKITTL
jgi:hypothetical protein